MVQPISVVFADESESVRLVLASMLRGDPRFGAVTAVASSAQVLASCEEADLVVTDLVLADGDAFALMGELRGRRRTLPVVIYTAVGPPYLRAEAAAHGAAAYHIHSDEAETVLDAFVAVVNGERSA